MMTPVGHLITNEKPVRPPSAIVRKVGSETAPHDLSCAEGGDESPLPDSNRGPTLYESVALDQLSQAGGNTNNRWYSRHRSRTSRFEALVDRSGGPDACWPWTGCRTKEGYGRFCAGLAHRFALEQKLGRTLADGKQALHDPRVCNSPPCCNPAHLREGTVKDNALDRLIAGTQSHTSTRGEAQGTAKLTDQAVLEIVDGYKAACASRVWGSRGRHFDAMAAKHGVSRRAVEYVAHGGTWTHVEDGPPTVEVPALSMADLVHPPGPEAA